MKAIWSKCFRPGLNLYLGSTCDLIDQNVYCMHVNTRCKQGLSWWKQWICANMKKGTFSFQLLFHLFLSLIFCNRGKKIRNREGGKGIWVMWQSQMYFCVLKTWDMREKKGERRAEAFRDAAIIIHDTAVG